MKQLLGGYGHWPTRAYLGERPPSGSVFMYDKIKMFKLLILVFILCIN